MLLGETDSEARFFRRLRLMDILSSACGREVEVVVLQDAPIILQYQVLKNGRLLLEGDRRARAVFDGPLVPAGLDAVTT